MVRGMGLRARAERNDGKGMVIRVPRGIELRSIRVPRGIELRSIDGGGDNMSNICFIGALPALLLAAVGCSGLLWT